MTANLDNRPTLLLGASGFFGPALLEAFGESGAVATHFSRAGAGSLHFDARSTPITDIVSRIPSRPAAAIILFGITRIDDCARNPSGTAEVNVRGVIRVIEELRTLEVMPVFASSDAVFDGSRALWSEDDETNPILEYGRQKLAVERYLSSLSPPWLVVRLPKLLAPGYNPRCMITAWAEALGREDRILCATDQYFTPVAAPDAAQAIAMLVRDRAQGLFHLGGPERLNRRALLGEVIDEYRRFAEPRADVVECSLRDIPVFEPRPLDTSLRSDRFASRFAYRFRAASAVARTAIQAFFTSGAAKG
ncbi:MAG: sugar nucleotide-binding protein [Betaproteobacteria bacterium]|nr:sugar nucleotide-binding protein [Betaproteobacteria bacterium]